MRILGIDPGSRITGFGVLEQKGSDLVYVTSGLIKTVHSDWPLRLKKIYDGLLAVVLEYQPTVVSIERVFVHQNPQTALKLGQARGVAILACASRDPIRLFEYAPRQIKQAVSGFGGAHKQQVQKMVQTLLKLDHLPASDAADALAAAICHQQMQRFLARAKEE